MSTRSSSRVGAQRFEALVEQLAGVCRRISYEVSPRASTAKFRCSRLSVVGADGLPETAGRCRGNSAVAERRGDDDEVGRRLQLGEFDLVELDGLGGDGRGRATASANDMAASSALPMSVP